MDKIRRTHQLSIVLFVLLLIFILCIPPVCSEYYADINISVDGSGFVSIEGRTNHPNLLVDNSELYTYKSQSFWLLNITKNEVFSDYIYSLTLPQGSTINYIRSSGFRGIEEKSGSLVITGSGGNESLSIVVQYQLNERSLDFNVLIVLGVLIFVLIVFLVFFVIQSKKKKLVGPVKKSDYVISFRGLTERQKQIMNLLIEVKRPLTQIEIEKELGIPKSAVSRNVHSLELKGLVEIEKVGMSNFIRLKKP